MPATQHQQSILVKELNCLKDIMKDPNNLALVRDFQSRGVIHNDSKLTRLRKLHMVLTNSRSNAIYYDYKKREWAIHEGTKDTSSYSHRVQDSSAHSNWKNSRRYINLPGTKVQEGDDDSNKAVLIRRGSSQAEYTDKRLAHYMYGVELEMLYKSHGNGNRGGMIKEVESIFGEADCCIKTDGSISTTGMDDRCEGIEVVTVPLTFADAKSKLSFFAGCGVTSKLAVNGTCGVHIHVGTEAMTEAVVSKLLHFVHRSHNNKFLKSIGGRSTGDNDFCRYLGDTITSLEDSTGFKNPMCIYALQPFVHDPNSSDPLVSSADSPFRFVKHDNFSRFTHHYDALSVSPRHDTLEFRIFKGSLDKSILLGYMEFVDALCTWCTGNSPLLDTDYRNFITWVMDGNDTRYSSLDRKPTRLVPRAQYPNLVKLLVSNEVKSWVKKDSTTGEYTIRTSRS